MALIFSAYTPLIKTLSKKMSLTVIVSLESNPFKYTVQGDGNDKVGSYAKTGY